MAYAAIAEGFPSSVTAAPRVVVLQRALLWLAGASSAIVFIEPSPYELVTLAAAVIFYATGLRLRLDFMPLVLLLFLVYKLQHQLRVTHGQARGRQLDRDILVHGDNRDLPRDGGVRRYGGAAGHPSPRPD